MARGGKRPGAGKKKGYKHQKTLEKEAARVVLREWVIHDMRDFYAAQRLNVLGIRHTFMRDKTGRFVQLTEPKQIEEALNSGDEGKYYWTFTKDPSIQAFTDLMNRALDKPAEQVQQVEVKGEISIVDVLRTRTARLVESK